MTAMQPKAMRPPVASEHERLRAALADRYRIERELGPRRHGDGLSH